METRRRKSTRYEPGHDYNYNIPYGGKVILAKRKLPESRLALGLQVFGVIFAMWFVYFTYYHTASLQFGLTWLNAQFGHDHAQHLLGQKYLQGYGVGQNHDNAIYWFKKAADQGHPHASYNLAIAHLKGYKTEANISATVHLVRHAANNRIDKAKAVLSHLCLQGICDDYHGAHE